jgi:hypothetical protein
MVKTTYYVKGTFVWVEESPEKLTGEQLNHTISHVASLNYGQVDYMTDSTGRLIPAKSIADLEMYRIKKEKRR